MFFDCLGISQAIGEWGTVIRRQNAELLPLKFLLRQIFRALATPVRSLVDLSTGLKPA